MNDRQLPGNQLRGLNGRYVGERRLEEPAMLVGLPVGFDPQARNAGVQWMDEAGIAAENDLAIFDLRMITTERLESRLST